MSNFTPPSFPPADAATRAATLDWIRAAPLVYGPWQGFKRLYKEAEAAYRNGAREPEIVAALLARIDEQPLETIGKSADVAVAGSFGALNVAGGFAYLWSRGRELQTYDLSAPAQPQLISVWSPDLTDPIPVGLEVSAGYLWLRSGGKVWRLNVENPSTPALDGEFKQNTFGTAIAGERIISLDGATLRVSEVRDGSLIEVGSGEFVQTYYGLIGGPNFAAAMTYNYGRRGATYELNFADLSDAANPRLAGKLPTDYASVLQPCGDFWLSFSNNELFTYDLSDLDNPRQIGKLKVEGASFLACEADRAAVFCQTWNRGSFATKIRLLDLSNPKNPSITGEYDFGSARYNEVSSLALAGDTLYLGTRAGLRLLDVSDPKTIQEIGKAPDPKTFAYMKRRGRRLLRDLSRSDADGFTALASAFFAEIADKPNLDWDNNWIAADLVAANHPNWHQASHGRGAYLYNAKSLVVKRRVERASDAWNLHPEQLNSLVENSVTAPVVHLARQATAATSRLSAAQIESYVASNWPDLRVIGARAALESDVSALSPRAVAGAIAASNPLKRRALLERAQPSPAIASELANFLGASLPIERDKFGRRMTVQSLTRRGRELALLLAARFDLSNPEFRADGALPALRALLNSSEAPLKSLGAQFCRRLSAAQVLPLIPFALNNAAVLEALLESASRADFDKEQIDKAVRAPSREARVVAWQLVAASRTKSATLGAVWLSLLRGLTQSYDWNARTVNWRISDALQSALSDADARAALVRGELDWREVRPRWSGEFAGSEAGAYYTNAGVPGEVFGAYALFLPAEVTVKTIADLTDARWGEWKTGFVAAIAPHPAIGAQFWGAVQQYLDAKKEGAEQLRARTFDDPVIAATFAGAAGQLAPALLLSLIASVPEAVWLLWRDALLQVLKTDAARREAFWEAARSQGFAGGFLRGRLIDDAEFAATFGMLESDVTQFDDPSLESLITLWLGARELDAETLIEAAIHPLPAVRAIGLSGLVARGLTVPIALRLLESDLRDAMDAAKVWFESREENIANLALALCDSPRLRARQYGREFVGARLDDLIGDGLLAKLEENPNAEMQGFVANLLLERDAETAPIEFDRAVLRGRNRARRAKNLVQTRRSQSAPLPDDATLLELARGKTPRDAEWALQQLARRALESEIAGVEVSGVGAI